MPRKPVAYVVAVHWPYFDIRSRYQVGSTRSSPQRPRFMAGSSYVNYLCLRIEARITIRDQRFLRNDPRDVISIASPRELGFSTSAKQTRDANFPSLSSNDHGRYLLTYVHTKSTWVRPPRQSVKAMTISFESNQYPS